MKSKMREMPATRDAGDQLEGNGPLTVMAFLIFGTFVNATFSLVITSAQDILAGTFIQTSTVLIANVGPYFLVCLIAPSFMQKIPYFARIVALFLAFLCGSLMFALAKQVHWKLIGVGLVSFVTGVCETTFLALTSFYHEVSFTAFSAGTGAGFVIAPFYYTGKSCRCVCISLYSTVNSTTGKYCSIAYI